VAVTYAIRHRVHGVRDSQGLGLFFWYPGPREWWVD
jgi:arabinogalactan endo-1,4-beta-galactosidase